ncbi:hypothetical protein [Catenuloplanes atrovinosus]|uniref:DNA-binding XRE family transcriptional regulator n=1 Tax=Catenuloplanes atrovinosus TaxID=137266 RepID=A0AAE3YV21_9ACTN|nr:hypothetical protein [Catenuloplanes atrovinosus]MDR7278898.1 DNA-binding XRE family transcriptional regulator [Catenuloplanes atrovinosus]
MIQTQTCDTESHESDVPPSVRLRVEVFDALMAGRGHRTVAAQADALGVNRSTLFRLRAGETVPNLDLAMTMAAVAGTKVEALFERAESSR